MKVFGIAGSSGMGKTTLLARLVPALVARGLAVSAIKHSHKDIELDRPGKDSHRLRDAGCREVLLLGSTRWALLHELRGASEPGLGELLERLSPCDLVLLEGFKAGDFPKLEVWRPAPGRALLWPHWPGIAGIATDDPDAVLARATAAAVRAALPPVLELADLDGLCDFVLARAAPAAGK